jgi:hypothetical protein
MMRGFWKHTHKPSGGRCGNLRRFIGSIPAKPLVQTKLKCGGFFIARMRRGFEADRARLIDESSNPILLPTSGEARVR